MDALPTPRNSDQRFWAGVCERLDRQTELLADICDRLPTRSGGQPEAAASGRSDEVEITEPAVPATPGETAPVSEPAAPPLRPPAKKSPLKSPARARRTAPKKGT